MARLKNLLLSVVGVLGISAVGLGLSTIDAEISHRVARNEYFKSKHMPDFCEDLRVNGTIPSVHNLFNIDFYRLYTKAKCEQLEKDEGFEWDKNEGARAKCDDIEEFHRECDERGKREKVKSHPILRRDRPGSNKSTARATVGARPEVLLRHDQEAGLRLEGARARQGRDGMAMRTPI